MKTRALLETRIWQPHNESVRKAVEAGLLVGTGTDSYGRLSDEIRLIAQAANRTPVQAIEHATSTSAKIIGRGDLGLLKEGRHANIAAFPGLTSASLLEQQSTVPSRFGYTARRSCNLKNGKEGNHHETNFT